MIRDESLGLIHICYGSGVGKTSRAVGLAIRAAGAGLRVDFIQFMKSGNSAEVAIFERIPNIYYRCPGKHPFIVSQGPGAVHYEHAQKALMYTQEAIERGTNLLICDEMLDTLLFNLLERDKILDLVERCKNKVELVMTGRNAPLELIEAADYVTEFVQKKHPYYKGARARRGIEY